MSDRPWEAIEDLAEHLRGPEGPGLRSSLLDHLQTLEAALTAEAALGGTPQAYAELQAALLAIRAGADTLRRLDIPEVERGDSPLVDPRALLSGEAS